MTTFKISCIHLLNKVKLFIIPGIFRTKLFDGIFG